MSSSSTVVTVVIRAVKTPTLTPDIESTSTLPLVSLSPTRGKDKVNATVYISNWDVAGEVVGELIDLTPTPLPSFRQRRRKTRATRKAQREKDIDNFRPLTPPPSINKDISRKAAGVRKAHRRAERGRTTATATTKVCKKANKSSDKKNQDVCDSGATTSSSQSRILTELEVILDWEKKQQLRLEACLLRGLRSGIFSTFDCHSCGPAVTCQREDNYIKHLGSKAHGRRLFQLKPWGCDKCAGSRRPFRSFSELIAHEKSTLHLGNTRR